MIHQLALTNFQIDHILHSLQLTKESYEKLVLTWMLSDNDNKSELCRLNQIIQDTDRLIARFELIKTI